MPAESPIDLDDLYQEIILDHYRAPRHAGSVSEGEALVDEENPTCGDQIRLTTVVEDGVVKDIRYEAQGCAISVASASMMAELVVGKSLDEARARLSEFVGMMTGKQEAGDTDWGDVVALEGVRNYPMRVKCATMSWHAMSRALQKLEAATA